MAKQFKDFGIKAETQGFTGDKIKINKVLNKEITVHDFKIEPSKFIDKGNGKCLHLQISIGETKYVVFTGSAILMQVIEKVDKSNFPFTTTIVQENDRYEFT